MEYLNGMGAKKQGFKQESRNIMRMSTGTLWQTLLVPCLIYFTLLLTNKNLIFFWAVICQLNIFIFLDSLAVRGGHVAHFQPMRHKLSLLGVEDVSAFLM